jgi:hypothetical protein
VRITYESLRKGRERLGRAQRELLGRARVVDKIRSVSLQPEIELIQERIVNHSKGWQFLVDERNGNADKWESVDKVSRPIYPYGLSEEG